jgi:small-conductance mechanosensitive channel
MPPTPSTELLDFFRPGALPYAAALIGGVIVLVRLMHRLLDRFSEKLTRHRLVIKQIASLIAFGLYTLAFVLAFTSLFQLSSEAMFALSGTIAVTLGFALKDVAASYLAGFTILTNKPFQVGDRISFGGYYGEVKEIGLRTVRMVTLDDNLVTIPNNKFLTDVVASANAGELDCMVVMTYHVLPEADHQRAREIVLDAVLASKYLYLGKPFTTLVHTKLQEHGRVVVEITAKAYVYDARHEKAFSSDVTDRVLRAFRSEGVPIPGAAQPLAETSAAAPGQA